jgi:hypothetical protein
MKRLATHIALLVFAGALSAGAPALAAPPAGGGNSSGTALNCNDPAMAKLPACLSKGKPGTRYTRPGSGTGNSPMLGQKPPPPSPGRMSPRPGPKGPPGPPPGPRMGPGHMGPPPGFQSFRHSFRFPQFAPPSFSVRPNIVVPRSYHRRLRPLPPQFFGYYPMYRGYLFFVTPGGQIVIVSPRTFRIIAIL